MTINLRAFVSVCVCVRVYMRVMNAHDVGMKRRCEVEEKERGRERGRGEGDHGGRIREEVEGSKG